MPIAHFFLMLERGREYRFKEVSLKLARLSDLFVIPRDDIKAEFADTVKRELLEQSGLKKKQVGWDLRDPRAQRIILEMMALKRQVTLGC